MSDGQSLGEQVVRMVERLNQELAIYSCVHFESGVLNVLFDKLLQLVRVFKMPRSHLLLVGLPGSGKIDLCLIAQRLINIDN